MNDNRSIMRSSSLSHFSATSVNKRRTPTSSSLRPSPPTAPTSTQAALQLLERSSLKPAKRFDSADYFLGKWQDSQRVEEARRAVEALRGNSCPNMEMAAIPGRILPCSSSVQIISAGFNRKFSATNILQKAQHPFRRRLGNLAVLAVTEVVKSPADIGDACPILRRLACSRVFDDPTDKPLATICLRERPIPRTSHKICRIPPPSPRTKRDAQVYLACSFGPAKITPYAHNLPTEMASVPRIFRERVCQDPRLTSISKLAHIIYAVPLLYALHASF
eukprot:5709426-Pleurochrysis_carterae.AAC.2